MIKIITYFPKPYPDELLYSVIARFQKHFGNSTPLLLKNIKVHSANKQPFKINHLQELLDNSLLGKCYTGRQLAFQHTLLPFSSAFLGQEEQRGLLLNLVSEWGVEGVRLIKKVGERSKLQFCPECIKSDVENYGEPYWHRIHQVPGVWVCIWHGTKLRDSCPECNAQFLPIKSKYDCISDRCINGHDLTKPIPDKFDEKLQQKLNAYALEVYKLLTNEYCYEPEDVCKRYIMKLRELGIGGAKNHIVKPDRLGDDFVKFYGYKYIHMMDSNDMFLPYKWLLSMVQRLEYRHLHHSLRHLLVIQFLFGSLEAFNSFNTEYTPFVEPEGAFGEVKWNMEFRRRRGTENVLTESILLGLAHNVNKLYSKIQNGHSVDYLHP